MNTAVKQLIEQFQKDIAQVDQVIEFAIAQKGSFLVQAILACDIDLRWGVNNEKKDSLKRNLITSIRHRAWNNYFNAVDLSNAVNPEIYSNAIKPYQYSDEEKRRHYSGVTELKDFTLENIEEFANKYLSVSESRLIDAVKGLLYRTGDFRKRNTEYKTRQTFKDCVSGKYEEATINRELCGEIAEVLAAVEYYSTDNYNPNRFGELRQQLFNRKPMDTETPVIDGVSVILKSTGSLELRLDKSVVALLNSKLPTTV